MTINSHAHLHLPEQDGSRADTIDKGAKYKVLGENVTLKREEEEEKTEFRVKAAEL